MTIGKTFAAGNPCTGSTQYVQTSSAAPEPSYAVPAPGGVITTMSTVAPGFAVSEDLIVYRFVSGTTYLVVGSTGLQPLNVNVSNPFATRIPVQAGDNLGIATGPAGFNCATNTLNTGDAFGNASGDPAVNTPQTLFGPFSGAFIDVAATVEPDADGDKFGDDTQDGCPTNAAIQTPCPASAPTTPQHRRCRKHRRLKRGKCVRRRHKR